MTPQQYLEGLADFGCELDADLQASEYRTRLYVQCRRNNCTIRMAKMLALRQFPGLRTDDSWHAGNKPFWAEYGEQYAGEVKTALEAQGVHLGSRDDYIPALARYKGDPNAVVSGHGARGQIAKALSKRNDHIRRQNEAPRVALADDIIQESIADLTTADPSLKSKPKGELREMVIEKHAPKFFDD